MIPMPPGSARGHASALAEDHWLTDGVMLRRLVAVLVDGALITVAMSMAWAFCLLFGVMTLGLGWPLFGALPAIPIIYHWLFLSAFAATPGQSLFGLTVRRDSDLLTPSPLEALAFTLLFYLTMALGMIWFALAIFTTRHRAPHDLICGLVVVHIRALTPPAASWNMRFGAAPPGGPTVA
jgi:uncharacterized RDD family membrane protein YckC